MLPERLAAYLTYFEQLANQPANHWNGFYVTQFENRGFGLRFQLAFPCYALGMICLHPAADPSEQERCRKAMAALIDRMQQRRVWAYWAVQAEKSPSLNPDPVARGNAQYSGHLAMMIGLYTVVGGDDRYEQEFVLRWSPDDAFVYTYSALVETLWRQMTTSDHHGVECEPEQVRVTSMCHVLWALELHDLAYGTDYTSANADWLTFVEQRLVLRGLRLIGQGIFNPFYTSRLRLMMPLSAGVVDAWSLAFLARLAPELTAELAPRYLRTIRHSSTPAEDVPLAHAPSSNMWQAREVADPTTTTGFSYLLAIELGQDELAAALLNCADRQFDLVEQDGMRCYTGGLSAAYTTALFALGEAGGLHALDTLRAQHTNTCTAEETDTAAEHAPDDQPTDTAEG